MKKINFVFKTVLVTTVSLSLTLFTSCKNAASGGSPNTPKREPTTEDLVEFEGRDLKIGDLIMSDGKVLPYSDEFITEKWENFDTSKAVAIIFREKQDTNPALGIGLYHTKDTMWSTDSDLNNIKITNLLCTFTKDGSSCDSSKWDSSITIDGYIDGSDSWEQICNFFAQPEQSENKDKGQNIENFPAFKYAKNYATEGDTNLQDTIYKDGWYLPTIAELVKVYENIELIKKIQNSVDTQNDLFLNKFENSYWTSNDSDYWTLSSIGFGFDKESFASYYKYFPLKVCVVHKF